MLEPTSQSEDHTRTVLTFEQVLVLRHVRSSSASKEALELYC